ncbi:stalk domain-containing protein [Paenibacillus xanthanilyticus]|uniref:Stalk domain-containing protein n=1 Tax=Paenibacillus xanthanilyticus TaxID=1783531 RepID=A0ABV8JYX6_9BACL
MTYGKQHANTGNRTKDAQRNKVRVGLAVKRLLTIALFLTCLPMTTLNAATAASDQASPALYIDGQKTAYKKVTAAGRSENMIGLRQAAHALKLALTWSAAAKEWTLSGGEKPIRVKLNAKTAFVGGQATTLAVPLREEKGTVYIPLRFVIEASGGEMQYYKESGINVVWALSHSQNQLNRAIMDGDAATVIRLLKDWRMAALPMGVDGLIPYTFAAASLPVTKALIEAGFPVNYRENPYADIIIPGGGYTLLHFAAGDGQADVVRYLLKQGADPAIRLMQGPGDDGWEPIDHAIHGLMYAPILLQLGGQRFTDDVMEGYMDTLRLLRPYSGLHIYVKDRFGEVLATGEDLASNVESASSAGTASKLVVSFEHSSRFERLTVDHAGSTVRLFINEVEIGNAKVPQSTEDGTLSFVPEDNLEEQITGMTAMIRLALDGSGES